MLHLFLHGMHTTEFGYKQSKQAVKAKIIE
jgi:hypothetical protein